jgi:hypothetical protein
MANAQVVNITVLTHPISQDVVDTEPCASDKDITYTSSSPSLRANGGEDGVGPASVSTSSARTADQMEQMTVSAPEDPRVTGAIASPRGALVLVITCTAQLLDLIL